MGSLEAGVRLRRMRSQAGLTQQQLAAKAGVSYFTIAKLEQGATKNPSSSVLYKLSAALEFDIDQFLAGKKNKTTHPDIKFFYSDIGGVLVHTELALFPHLSSDYNRQVDDIRLIYHRYVPVACRGNLSFRDLQLLMLLKLNLKYKTARQRILFKHWVDYMTPIAPAQTFLAYVAKQLPVGLLTDTIEGFVERMEKRKLLPSIRYKTIVKSSDEGMIKPAPQLFATATKRAGVAPEHILFVDDKKYNVKGARAFGWQAEWFDELDPKGSIARIRRKYF